MCKLNIYNLTAHLSTNKKVYCSIWTEYTGGRSGNDLASALFKILNKILEENCFNEIITWSDSCVPQNKNSIMSTAILRTMQLHPELTRVTMKFFFQKLQIHFCASVSVIFSRLLTQFL